MAGLKLPNYGTGFQLPNYGTSGYVPPSRYMPSNFSLAGPANYGAANDVLPPMPSYLPNSNVNYGLGADDARLPNFSAGPASPSWLSGMNSWGKENGLWGGTTENPSMGGAILGAGSALSKAWMGMQAYGLAKDSLESSKAQWAKQYAATRQITNANLEDRQIARVASNPGAYQSVGAYMGQHGVAA